MLARLSLKQPPDCNTEILAEQQRGNKYWVKIQASVEIPAQYVLDKETPEREDLGDNINNFVQKYPQGEINWGTGVVLAFGKGVIYRCRIPPTPRKMPRAPPKSMLKGTCWKF